MALRDHWKFDDNAASTTVVATTGDNAAIAGGENTDDMHVADGPGTAITSSFVVDDTTNSVDISGSSLSITSGQPFTFFIFLQVNPGGAQVNAALGSVTGGRPYIGFPNDTTLRVRGGTHLDFTFPDVSSGWHSFQISMNASNEVRAFMDGVESSTGTLTTPTFGGVDRIGAAPAFGATGYLPSGTLMSWAQWYDSDESANAVALDAQKDGGGGGPSPSPYPYAICI
jgi:hypothetical protein